MGAAFRRPGGTGRAVGRDGDGASLSIEMIAAFLKTTGETLLSAATGAEAGECARRSIEIGAAFRRPAGCAERARASSPGGGARLSAATAFDHFATRGETSMLFDVSSHRLSSAFSGVGGADGGDAGGSCMFVRDAAGEKAATIAASVGAVTPIVSSSSSSYTFCSDTVGSGDGAISPSTTSSSTTSSVTIVSPAERPCLGGGEWLTVTRLNGPPGNSPELPFVAAGAGAGWLAAESLLMAGSLAVGIDIDRSTLLPVGTGVVVVVVFSTFGGLLTGIVFALGGPLTTGPTAAMMS